MATSAATVPLTVQCCLYGNLDSIFAIGTNLYSQSYQQNNLYWILVVDRTNLAVVQNFTFSDNADVPTVLNQYVNNPQYMMMMTTLQLLSSNLPTGNFYNFLVSIGAGIELRKLEQLYGSLNCGNWACLGYTLVTVFDTTGGIEFSSYQDNMVNIMSLLPVQVGSGVLYTPQQLQ